ncbi:General amino acid permease [Lasiodiplodia theobromae]|uniref:General amino acid permease AGP2 n=1 Tax=Lasiodiplodia theobromae TaxID=45133 RepID=A0A5N5CWD0_9PEZI|nr:General amino acid permease [Lasiodiplodia theobromae]KAB2569663.1 General amino acid permease AGP2 [Lasiodiplodia theobromae]KAF4539645.1 General amino acid permease [Lasiodiplodia theobromae]
MTDSPPPHEKASPSDVRESSLDAVAVAENADQLHRRLSNRQIQWIAIGGSIGTALFVSIGYGLIEGGPGSLFIAFTLYSCMMGLVNSCLAEMVIFMPVSGSWMRMASKWVDEALGFTAGWNFYLYEAILIPFEISALNLVLGYWSDKIPLAAICAACIVLYAIINLFAVRWYGEAEFWLSSGKLLLIFMMFAFTFITMVGGNPQRDAYGFRYWRTPGSFAEYVTTGTLGRFEGFLGAFYQASFTIVGPEYIGMVSGEAIYPRKTIKQAFKTVYWRFGCFFILGALCVGIVLPYDDPKLNALLGEGATGDAGASPYVIAMQNMGITVLPDITNALLVTSIFSAGNSYVYAATRSLYALALDGHAPKFLRKVNRQGIPIWSFAVTMIFPFLSFLSVGASASEGLKWLANLTQAAQVMNYIIMCTVYLFFYRALKVQGYDRNTLPYKGWYQPYTAYLGLLFMILTVSTYGYTVFLPGWWNTGTFFTYYAMVFVCIILFAAYKVIKRSKIVRPQDADLVWERPIIDAYEASIDPPLGIWEDIGRSVGLKRKIGSSED